jgi:hypothetical protein
MTKNRGLYAFLIDMTRKKKRRRVVAFKPTYSIILKFLFFRFFIAFRSGHTDNDALSNI